jgi:hypothetical protein
MMSEIFEAMDRVMADRLKVSLEDYISKIEPLDEDQQEKIVVGILTEEGEKFEEAYKLYHSL